MSIPITDNRYFTLGVDDELARSLDIFDPQEYEREYIRMSIEMPELFSLNLKEEIEILITTSPPRFRVDPDRAIELACYYYSDWNTMVTVIDEFIQTELYMRAEKELILSQDCTPEVIEKLDEEAILVSGALTRFIGVIIGLLTRAGAPAITEYGCCYRLENIDDFGNVFFRLRNPSQVYADLCGGVYDGRQDF